jgi:UDP-glucuronate 4-epimerase
MNYLISGCAGFIGSHLCERLICGNHIVRDKNFYFYESDILNKESLHKIFAKNNIDIVIHLAAKAGVRPSIDDPLGYYETNVKGTLNILETMKEIGCKKMIFASSSSVYGNNPKIPFSEEDKVDNPISPYAATKKAAELLCYTYHHLFSFDIFCLRFFTVYGPRQRPDLAIHKFTKLIMDGKPIPFYGEGNTERDYTYIDDIIDGIIKAIEKLKGYDIFNLGASKTISLTKMISTIEKTIDKKAILEKFPLQPDDVERTFADITKAKQKLGYEPKISFEEGINKFIYLLTNKNV